MNKDWLNNKTVIVTGASSGIGRGLTTTLIQEHGCTVLGIGRRENRMKELAASLGDDASRFSYQLFDVSEWKNWAAFRADLQKRGIQPDILINNAGALPPFDRFRHYSIEQVDAVMAVNFYGAVYATHELLPLLLHSSSPAVVNVASADALMPLAGTTAYSAAKAALKAFTEALREELRGRCYVGVVCPGFTKTDIFRSQACSDEKEQRMLRAVSCSCDKMVKKIIKGMRKQRGLMVIGADAQCMKYGAKWMPVQGGRLFSSVLKRCGLSLFDSVFEDG